MQRDEAFEKHIEFAIDFNAKGFKWLKGSASGDNVILISESGGRYMIRLGVGILSGHRLFWRLGKFLFKFQ